MKNRWFVTLAMITLFVSSFPFAMGWLPIGAFIPRFAFLVYALFAYPFVLQSRQFVFLCLYFLYIYVASIFVGVRLEIAGFFANFMEMGIPIVAMTVLHRQNISRNYESIGYFSLSTTFITIIASLYVLTFLFPDAIRAIVGMVANGESVTSLFRMGVADYSTAAMVMAMPCVLVGLYKNTRSIRKRNLCIVGIGISFLFMYLAAVTTTFYITILLFCGALFVNHTKSVNKNLRTIVPTFVLLFVFLTPILLNFLSGVDNENISSRTSMIIDYQESGIYDDNDLGTRVQYYRLSLNSFLEHPIFGRANALVGGHAYILDCLGRYGILGTLLHVLLILFQCKISYSIVPNELKINYVLMALGLLALAFSKNLSGIGYWTFLFLYYPCILYLGKSRERNVG